MKWLPWLLLGVGSLVMLAIGLQMIGRNRWADLIRTHRGQLEAIRFNTSAYAPITDGPTTLTLLFKFNEASLTSSVHAALRGAGVGKEMVMLPWNCLFVR
jgi:hypothetical protein